MSHSDQPAILLPAEAVETILAAAGHSDKLAPAQMQAIRGWLSDAWASAVRQASTKPLTGPDVRQLESAYNRFRRTIEALQDRRDPPPLIPPEVPELGDSTPWDRWLLKYQEFGFRLGRGRSSNWWLTAHLLLIYERSSSRHASTAKPNGPTMRFLHTAMNVLSEHAPKDVRSDFAPPNAETLRKQLPGLRANHIRVAGRLLDKAMQKADD